MQNDNNTNATPAQSRKKKWILIIGAVVLLLVAGAGVYASHIYNKTENIVEESHEEVGRENETSELRDVSVDPVEDNVSVLFMGVDNSEHRDENASRTDALLLATFNKDLGSIKLLSIPRDTYVYVREVGYFTKINHAHFFGGTKATLQTVEDFLNVPVDYYVRMNFNAFVEVVDALGGIMFDVPYAFSESDSDDNKNAIYLEAGYQHLNGEEALALARTRKQDSDVERGKRQQEIITAVAKKATSASSVFKLGDVLDAIAPNMKTNLTFDHMKSFLAYGLDEEIKVEDVNLDGVGTRHEDGLWYYDVYEENRIEVEQELRQHLDLEIEDEGE
ncbi:LCP family glycopolymer transferase [Oceanobacillus halotolerans]|uniref:LCP family glycopolymer transferase n=1 Tax=Oceanobacillus halotolerans TaxID=2663380 RepID=UPI0013DA58DA|nr:LCP family protein [Oceanobacillus halotolerans]